MSVGASIVTNQDIKSAAKTSIIAKWQQCRDISKTGKF